MYPMRSVNTDFLDMVHENACEHIWLGERDACLQKVVVVLSEWHKAAIIMAKKGIHSPPGPALFIFGLTLSHTPLSVKYPFTKTSPFFHHLHPSPSPTSTIPFCCPPSLALLLKQEYPIIRDCRPSSRCCRDSAQIRLCIVETEGFFCRTCPPSESNFIPFQE